MELGIPGDLGARYLYGVKPYREIIKQGVYMELRLPGDHGAKLYREIMELVIYMELSLTGRSWS